MDDQGDNGNDSIKDVSGDVNSSVSLPKPQQRWCQIRKNLNLIREGKMEERCEVVPRTFLFCRLCEEEFQQPKILPCLHSFCKSCIESYVENNKDEEGYFGCPVCGTETTIQEQPVENLPDNLFARRLSNPVVHIPMPKKEKLLLSCCSCQQHGSKTEAEMHCINCDDFLCSLCSESHQLEVETASHKLQNIKEENETKSSGSSTPTDLDILPRCCEYYDPYDIGSMFCVDCNMTLCSECHLKHHSDHRCAELSAVAENFENKIKVPISELAHDVETLNVSMSDLELAKSIVKNEQSELRRTVHQRTKFLCQMIKDYEDFVLEEIDRRYNNYLQNIEQQENEISLRVASIHAVTDFTEKLVSFGSEEEKVSMRHKIGRRVRELCEEELPTVRIDMTNHFLHQPEVNVETICDLFGELKTNKASKSSNSRKVSINSGLPSTSESVEQNETELTELEEYEDRDSDMLSASYASDPFRSSNTSDQMHLMASQTEPENSSFQSSLQEDVPCQNLTTPKTEFPLPENIQRDCIKGVATNSSGDIVIATVSNGTSMIYYIEKRGIVRGQIQVEKGWSIHSIAADGKVALVIARGDNRYKVRILSDDGCGSVLADVHIESFGLNYVTANGSSQVIVSSSRYTQPNRAHMKTAKSGGNIAIYNPDSQLVQRITNEDFQSQDIYLLEKPHTISVDSKNNIYVTDSGSHTVCAFTETGELLFEYGNTDHDDEIYQGPDAICTDRHGNIIVTDRRERRIDVLNEQGHLQKCLYPEDNIKSVSVCQPENLLMVATIEGPIKFYEYL